MRRLVIAAVAAVGVVGAVAAATRRRAPSPGMPPLSPGAGVREPRVPSPLAPAGQAFVDD